MKKIAFCKYFTPPYNRCMTANNGGTKKIVFWVNHRHILTYKKWVEADFLGFLASNKNSSNNYRIVKSRFMLSVVIIEWR